MFLVIEDMRSHVMIRGVFTSEEKATDVVKDLEYGISNFKVIEVNADEVIEIG